MLSLVAAHVAALALAAAPKATLPFPPQLPNGQTVAIASSPAMLKPTETLRSGVAIARTAPTIDLMYLPGQNYPGKPWSVWGDGVALGGKYYTSIGDHLSPQGDALVYEYDPATKQCRKLVSVKALLDLPEGHYMPGKIHGRLDAGSDGWLYFSTHRGSTKVTADAYHYTGDWIARVDPRTAKAEVVVRAPVERHCIPASVVDPERMIFYGGTAPGADAPEQGIQFFAYDLKNRKMLYSGPNGPGRYMALSRSTGRVYFVAGESDGPLWRYDPAAGGPPQKLDAELGIRAATQETPSGMIYTISKAGKEDATLWSIDTKTETVARVGVANVASQGYCATLDADPSGRFLYYVPGAHGGGELDGSPVVQFDIEKKRAKVICFLHPFCREQYGVTLKGTFSIAVDPSGERLYITWNASRSDGRDWDCTVLTTIHIPAAERQ
jgi:hypothetical protein